MSCSGTIVIVKLPLWGVRAPQRIDDYPSVDIEVAGGKRAPALIPSVDHFSALVRGASADGRSMAKKHSNGIDRDSCLGLFPDERAKDAASSLIETVVRTLADHSLTSA